MDVDEIWGMIGVSENIIEVSWFVFNDVFEYKLFKED